MRSCCTTVLFVSIKLLCTATCLCCCNEVSAIMSSRSKPNIVLILADDLGYECVGVNGGESYTTPHLDRLAADGMRFEHCHSQPLCTPTRVQIMTGRYNSRNYIRFGLLDPKEKTFGNMMHDAGYATCIIGKWQLEGGLKAPKKFGFDEYCLWQLTRRPNRYANPGLEVNGKEVDYKNGAYGPDIVSNYACDFMERNKNKPFFLYYPMMLPHYPFDPTPDSKNWNPKFRRADTEELRKPNDRSQRHFVEMVAYTDKMVGKIVAKLDALGIRDKTLVVFTGDNGTYAGLTSILNGKPYIGGKGRTTDNGTHVPLIASWPGKIPAGKVNQDLIDFTDIFPTIAETTGASLPKDFDGRSFLPQLLGKSGRPRAWIYCWYYRNGQSSNKRGGHRKETNGGKSAGEFARNKQYKYYLHGDFYDVVADPSERHKLAAAHLTDDQKKIRNELQSVVEQFKRPNSGKQK